MIQINAEAAPGEGRAAQGAVRSARFLPALDRVLPELNPGPAKHNDNAQINEVKISLLTPEPFHEIDVLNTKRPPIIKKKTSTSKRE